MSESGHNVVTLECGCIETDGHVTAPCGEHFQGAGGFKSIYGQLMSTSTIGGGLSLSHREALRALDGLMVAAEHALQGFPVGAGAHSTICALLMDAYAKGLRSAGEPGHRQHDGDQGNADQAVEHGKDPS